MSSSCPRVVRPLLLLFLFCVALSHTRCMLRGQVVVGTRDAVTMRPVGKIRITIACGSVHLQSSCRQLQQWHSPAGSVTPWPSAIRSLTSSRPILAHCTHKRARPHTQYRSYTHTPTGCCEESCSRHDYCRRASALPSERFAVLGRRVTRPSARNNFGREVDTYDHTRQTPLGGRPHQSWAHAPDVPQGHRAIPQHQMFAWGKQVVVNWEQCRGASPKPVSSLLMIPAGEPACRTSAHKNRYCYACMLFRRESSFDRLNRA